MVDSDPQGIASEMRRELNRLNEAKMATEPTNQRNQV